MTRTTGDFRISLVLTPRSWLLHWHHEQDGTWVLELGPLVICWTAGGGWYLTPEEDYALREGHCYGFHDRCRVDACPICREVS